MDFPPVCSPRWLCSSIQFADEEVSCLLFPCIFFLAVYHSPTLLALTHFFLSSSLPPSHSNLPLEAFLVYFLLLLLLHPLQPNVFPSPPLQLSHSFLATRQRWKYSVLKRSFYTVVPLVLLPPLLCVISSLSAFNVWQRSCKTVIHSHPCREFSVVSPNILKRQEQKSSSVLYSYWNGGERWEGNKNRNTTLIWAQRLCRERWKDIWRRLHVWRHGYGMTGRWG